MAKTIFELMNMAWERQGEHLHGLSQLELEVLLNQLSRVQVKETEKESFDLFYMATYSILRDLREDRKKGSGRE